MNASVKWDSFTDWSREPVMVHLIFMRCCVEALERRQDDEQEVVRGTADEPRNSSGVQKSLQPSHQLFRAEVLLETEVQQLQLL